MEFGLPLLLFLTFLPLALAQDSVDATIVVNGSKTLAETDSNYICATIDWWPSDKCNYNRCPWGNSSAINLDLSHPFLAKAIKAFESLRIRVGGSLQDQVLYDVGTLKFPCHPFRKMKDGLFGFSKGCLHTNRWDALNHLFNQTGAIVTFGLNALNGRQKSKRSVWTGPWDPSNAHNFINYTVAKGYKIDSWELGNELSGSGVGASVHAEQYGKDLIKLKGIINELYNNSHSKPSLIAPGGFFDQHWFAELLRVSGSNIVNGVTHHIYNLGAGADPNLVHKILDPHFLNKASETFGSLDQTIQMEGPWASAWVGESGGAYNSGGHLVSDTFVNSFWYLDQLGMASKYKTKVYCRQTLIGGNYGLLNTTTFSPNPDYYSAILWHRLMGKGVLAIHSKTSPFLRSYAHCSKGREGVTLLLINLSNRTRFRITAQNGENINLHAEGPSNHKESSFVRGLRRTLSWVGQKASDGSLDREEYHLTADGGQLRSQTIFLNGRPLKTTEDGNIPSLDPEFRPVHSPIFIAPLSIAFIVLPKFEAPAC
ncbi:heparanase-like protein 1 [Malania oleifera]|uniref:heparanase-like protein 1 n=1 Tax=Malania oleifera TaxID=397392 RepID=UPI0025ADE2B6|nr:heparanase-like protein 1 [Malania oleifera]XP_057951836.1 heparanase-like protein 1 [Malania oleifera]XP_057951837.1 heparanase-like protein 1 [Malania oleifera]XP_057951838.1 heparanase-like protein 1 [Malania oleifera]XP_057951839.1 heparanase-like protein 1 [Malania oleifera]XP_057951840.1 heparanase-like protein 1 [Malania oleifera]XP_057951841.1 heparanase-like protein 1 [Malania oleifera]XP_057951842.1 heparanase-like protein 1 [Malania oleifera]